MTTSGWNSAPASVYGGIILFPSVQHPDRSGALVAATRPERQPPEQLTAFRHTFSHFHLDIVPMWLNIDKAGCAMDEGAGLWYNLTQPPSVGLAAPVERLLQQLAKQPPIQPGLFGNRAIDEELA
ncbi:NUDIX domain-containing protein [Serratia sp. L9]|uniref:NUDIX domain-containing protein n=1 Tax=Serratia sp. L9 TaxID=3423946 RepID=UPI003D6786A8